jgi:hypothetical protein
MRQILLVICISSIPLLVFSQVTEYGSFKISGTEIIYQKVFNQDSITTEKLGAFLKTVSNVSNVEISSNGVQADLNDLVVDYKKFQFTQVATPPIIQTGRYSGKVSAECRDGRYRITVTSIMMKGDIGYKKIPNPEKMTNYACTNSGTVLSKDWCRPNMLGLLEMAFTDSFQYKKPETGSDW